MKRKILIWGFCLTLMVLAFSGCSAQKAELISIGSDGLNVCRKLDHDGVFHAVVPEGGRVIIFAPDFTLSYDSLYVTAESIPVTAGSYVIFIGNEGESFPYDYTF